MYKWFSGIKTVDELRKRYKELLKKYHPDNGEGDLEAAQEINAEYDRLFAVLRREQKSDGKDKKHTYDDEAENEAFKSVLNAIIHINADIEIIGSWIWVSNGFRYRELLKSVGFKYAPKKKCWTWHYGEYRRHHSGEVSLDTIREKYGSQTVRNRTKQYALD